jgi:hypothetical protein
MPIYTKSRNMRYYRFFCTLPESELEISDELAKKSKIHKNKLISLFAQAGTNENIFLELMEEGKSASEIPKMFKRPENFDDGPSETIYKEDSNELQASSSQASLEREPAQPGIRFPSGEFISEEKLRTHGWSFESLDGKVLMSGGPRKHMYLRPQHRTRKKTYRDPSLANDPFTYMRIALENPEFREQYERMPPEEQREYRRLVITTYNIRYQQKLAEEQAKIFQWMFWWNYFNN